MLYAEPFRLLQVTEFFPTFRAEIAGIDFSESVSDETFEEVLAVITKVRYSIHTVITSIAHLLMSFILVRNSCRPQRPSQ
jgi:hypothetical protein